MNAMAHVARKKFSPFLPATIDWKSTRSNGSFYVGINCQNSVGVRAEITYGSAAGADSNGNYKLRNLSHLINLAGTKSHLHGYLLQPGFIRINKNVTSL
jgi:hypothetical protein